MKTPREILLQRHKDADAYLDTVRRIALDTMEPPGLAEILRDRLYSLRFHLVGLGAVWLAVLILNISSSLGQSDSMAREDGDKIPPARVILAALLENRRELLELTDTPPAAEPAEPAALPPRRSEIQTAMEIV